MGDQRQLFRFLLPWRSAATTPRPIAPPAPRPAAEPQPAVAAQAPSQPSTVIPVRRLPFRPAGIAPVQASPTEAPQQKTEPQPAPAVPSRAATDLKSTSQPASPARLTNQIRAPSVPSSPPRRATEILVTSQPVSTFRAPTQERATSVPPSPSRIASLSPPKITATATSTQLPSSTPQRTTFRPFGAAVKPSETSAQPKEVTMVKPSEAAPQPKEVAAIAVAAIETPSAPVKPKEREERKKVEEKRRKAATKDSIREEPEQRTITKLLAAATEAGTKTRELVGTAVETGKRHLGKHEDIERKKTRTISCTDEKQIRTVSSTFPKDGSMPLHKEIREDISKFVHKLTTAQTKLPTDEKPVSVLTLAGENRGASFQMGSESTKKDGLVQLHQGYKITSDDSSDAATDGEGSSTGRKPKDSMTKESPAPSAYVNSNTQSINNSFVLDSSVKGRNPGVHLDFFDNLQESTKSSAKPEPIETHKAEFNITPAETLTYEPTVRRICFRGLFAEPSDSDPDNPEMP